VTCILATNNPDKVRELRALFGVINIEVLSLKDIGLDFIPREDGNTFEANARQKAREVGERLDQNFIIMADDSGLCIDVLGGLPGVDSALYMGRDTPYDIRNAHILEQMRGVPEEKRTARFVCVAACVLPNGEIISATGTMEGRIALESAGDDGFGYDPIFYLPEYGCTNAQLSMEEKNKISHRGKAMRQMIEMIKDEGLCKF